MTETDQRQNSANPASEAIATAVQLANNLSQAMSQQWAAGMTAAHQIIGPVVYPVVEQGTETAGRIVAPIADNPLVKYATKLPVLSWLMAAIGQVDVDDVQQEVKKLRQQHPLETPEELANRVIADTAWQAAGIGFITNIVPPVALLLAPIDLSAIAALQARMVYRIAAIYGFAPEDATRRGEVLVIWGLSTGSSSIVKSGLNIVELLPIVGTAIAVSSNAAILYTLGNVACAFYEEKRRRNQTLN